MIALAVRVPGIVAGAAAAAREQQTDGLPTALEM